jgi:U3 small nucleolar ribonucleoprotein component
MSFKENLLTKIKIDRLAAKVMASIGPAESGSKVDKESMRSLLEMSPYAYQRARDLDLYVEEIEQEQKKIFVLDNELPIYKTTVADVSMRKSPLIKEMVNIRNMIKILKDSDVKLSRKEESVKAVQSECIAQLDLSYDESDIEEIAKDGISSFERDYTDGVIECLELFAELLAYKPAPKAFQLSRCKIIGALTSKAGGEVLYGPLIIYSLIHGTLTLIDEQISNFDKTKIELVQQVAAGKQKAAVEGTDVFHYLKDTTLKSTVLNK